MKDGYSNVFIYSQLTTMDHRGYLQMTQLIVTTLSLLILLLSLPSNNNDQSIDNDNNNSWKILL